MRVVKFIWKGKNAMGKGRAFLKRILIYMHVICTVMPAGAVPVQAKGQAVSGGGISAMDIDVYDVSVTAYGSFNKIEWKAGRYANVFMVERSTDGVNYEVLAGYTYFRRCWDEDVEMYTRYYYRITPYSFEGETGQSAIGYTQGATLNKPVVKLIRSSVSKVSVCFMTQEMAEGYEIYRATQNGSYKLVKNIPAGKTALLSNGMGYYKSSVNSKKTYYYKARSYITVKGKKYYSAFSDKQKLQGFTKQYIKKKLRACKKIFKNGRYWNHIGKSGNGDTSMVTTKKPCAYHTSSRSVASSCNSYLCDAANIYGYQCAGFAWKLSDLTFGEDAAVKKFKSFSKVKLGDVIRYSGHSVIVIEKHKTYVRVAECNYDGHCRIKWNRKVTKSQLKRGNATYYTRY